MRRSFAPVGMCLLVLSAMSSAWAQDVKPTSAIPESASLVIRCKAPKATWGKAADIVEAVQPGFGAAVRGSLPSVGPGIGNPKLQGVDVDKDVWVMIFAESQAIPTIAYMMTAKDVEDIKDGLSDQYEFHAAGNLVVYSDDEDTVARIREQMSGKEAGLWAKTDAASKKLIDDSDLAVMVNLAQLTEDFSGELEQAEPQLNAVIDQIINNLPDAQRTQLEAVFEMYRSLGKSVVHGVRDAQSLTLAVGLSKTGIRIDTRLQVKESSSTAEYLAKQTPNALLLMSKLPADKSAYIGFNTDLSKTIQWSMSLTKGMIADATDEQKAAFDNFAAAVGKIKYEEVGMYMDLGTEAPLFTVGTVNVLSPTETMRTANNAFVKAMGKIKIGGLTQENILEPKVEKVAGFDVDRITVKQTLDETADPQGVQQKVYDSMFGADGMQQMIMYQPKRIVQMIGGGKSQMEQLVAAVDASTPSSKLLAETRKRFPEKANLIALFDLARLATNGIKIASQNGLPVNASGLDGLTLTPSFVGFSLACETSSVRTQIEIPVTTAQNIAKIIIAVGH